MSVAPTVPTGALAAHATQVRALPVLLLGAFLAVLDFFVVNVALPSIGTSLGASASGLELVVAGYGVGYACTLVAGGRLGDLYGRRRLFVLGMAAFTVTSALCGAAPTMTALILARVLQGVAAGLMVPQVLAVIQASFHGSARERALGLYGAMLGAATVAGQLIGGAIVELDLLGLGWRPIFLVNVPLGIAGDDRGDEGRAGLPPPGGLPHRRARHRAPRRLGLPAPGAAGPRPRGGLAALVRRGAGAGADRRRGVRLDAVAARAGGPGTAPAALPAALRGDAPRPAGRAGGVHGGRRLLPDHGPHAAGRPRPVADRLGPDDAAAGARVPRRVARRRAAGPPPRRPPLDRARRR